MLFGFEDLSLEELVEKAKQSDMEISVTLNMDGDYHSIELAMRRSKPVQVACPYMAALAAGGENGDLPGGDDDEEEDDF